jgi:hypothetical protein
MASLAHSDWTFEHSQFHHSDAHFDPHTDVAMDAGHPAQTDSVASVLKTLWHHTDLMSGGAAASGTSTATSGKPVAPVLTVTSAALTVDAGGSVALPVSVTPSQGSHAVSVTISGLASYETVTDALDHQTFSGSSITLSAAQVNSGLSLASNYTGADHPVNTLSLTAMDTVGHHAVLSDAQSIVVTDPPVASGSTAAPATTAAAATTTTTASNPLTLQVSGDMLGSTDPQIQVFVDGQQVGNASYDITAHHAQGQTQTIQIAGNFDPTVAHQVQVKLINDNWDGTATTDGHDINVYVSSISLNGATVTGAQGTSNTASNGAVHSANAGDAVMDINGALAFNVPADPPPATGGTGTATGGTGTGTAGTGTGTTGSGSSTSSGLTLQVSGDMMGTTDPQIQVFVDGQQVGNASYTVTAHHSQGQTQTIQIAGNFDPTVSHQVQVKFLNDNWDGTATTDGHDVNLYVSSITLNGTVINGSQGVNTANNGAITPSNATEAVMDVNGTLTFGQSTAPSTGANGAGAGTGTVGVGAGAAPSGPGFYVSATGSDSNPGTQAAPFATLARAQQAMENSSIKATYVEGGTYHMSSTLTLTAADNGETWQYYPASGVDSAVLDGAGSIDLVLIKGGSNITINGLKLQNFAAYGIHSEGGPTFGVAAASGNTIENCDIGFNTATGWNTGGFYAEGAAPNTTIVNNYVHDLGSMGIAINTWFSAGDKIDGSVIANNVVLRTVERMSDGGAIYLSMHGGDQTSHVTVTNNFVRDYGGPGVTGAAGVYLDDNASHVTVTGNVIAPPTQGTVSTGNLGATAFEMHNGNSNVISDNIVDLGDSGRALAAVWFQDSASVAGMGGNTFTGNVVMSDFAGNQNTNFSGQSGYTFYENSSSSNFTINNNIYFNYAGGQVRTDGPSASDSHPTTENPQISGWTYQIASTSPVLAAGFAKIVGGWGPTGFAIPQTGTAPSA